MRPVPKHGWKFERTWDWISGTERTAPFGSNEKPVPSTLRDNFFH